MVNDDDENSELSKCRERFTRVTDRLWKSYTKTYNRAKFEADINDVRFIQMLQSYGADNEL